MDILRFVELAGTIKQGFGLPVKPKTVVIPRAENMVRTIPKVDFNTKEQIMEELKRKLDPTRQLSRQLKRRLKSLKTIRVSSFSFPPRKFSSLNSQTQVIGKATIEYGARKSCRCG